MLTGKVGVKMKKILAIMLLKVICISVCSCDPSSFAIDRDSLNDVVSVDLIEYANSNQKHFTTWVSDQFDKLVPFVPANATILETLPSEKISDFLDAFSATDILHTYYAYDSPKDICIRLNYKNGNFLIVWANYAESSYAGYIGECSEDGTVLSFWGSFSSLHCYKDLIDQYFNYEV